MSAAVWSASVSVHGLWIIVDAANLVDPPGWVALRPVLFVWRGFVPDAPTAPRGRGRGRRSAGSVRGA
ncbi:MAG: hypothetical protein ACQSGP_16255, partial [Frankia sp.]